MSVPERPCPACGIRHTLRLWGDRSLCANCKRQWPARHRLAEFAPRRTRSTPKYPRRSIAVRPQHQYEALQQRRALERTRQYAHEYARRAGIEGTISQGVRRCGLRRSRYRGLSRIHVGHVLTAAALNYVRVADWPAGVPRAQTRPSRFATLMNGR